MLSLWKERLLCGGKFRTGRNFPKRGKGTKKKNPNPKTLKRWRLNTQGVNLKRRGGGKENLPHTREKEPNLGTPSEVNTGLITWEGGGVMSLTNGGWRPHPLKVQRMQTPQMGGDGG